MVGEFMVNLRVMCRCQSRRRAIDRYVHCPLSCKSLLLGCVRSWFQKSLLLWLTLGRSEGLCGGTNLLWVALVFSVRLVTTGCWFSSLSHLGRSCENKWRVGWSAVLLCLSGG